MWYVLSGMPQRSHRRSPGQGFSSKRQKEKEGHGPDRSLYLCGLHDLLLELPSGSYSPCQKKYLYHLLSSRSRSLPGVRYLYSFLHHLCCSPKLTLSSRQDLEIMPAVRAMPHRIARLQHIDSKDDHRTTSMALKEDQAKSRPSTMNP